MNGAWVFILLILLPNLLIVFFPPDKEWQDFPLKGRLKIIEFIEQLSRFAFIGLSVFLTIKIESQLESISLALSLVAYFIYLSAWFRYYRLRKQKLLFAPLFGFPQPMALSPCFILFNLSYLTRSLPFFLIVTTFTITHIAISQLIYKQIK